MEILLFPLYFYGLLLQRAWQITPLWYHAAAIVVFLVLAYKAYRSAERDWQILADRNDLTGAVNVVALVCTTFLGLMMAVACSVTWVISLPTLWLIRHKQCRDVVKGAEHMLRQAA